MKDACIYCGCTLINDKCPATKDCLIERAKAVITYCDYHRPQSDDKPYIKEFLIDDMYKLLNEIVLNN